jgi:hypothetical protein
MIVSVWKRVVEPLLVFLGGVASILTIIAILFPRAFVSATAELLLNQGSILEILEAYDKEAKLIDFNLYGNPLIEPDTEGYRLSSIREDAKTEIEFYYEGIVEIYIEKVVITGPLGELVVRDLDRISKVLTYNGLTYFEDNIYLGENIEMCAQFILDQSITIVQKGTWLASTRENSDSYEQTGRKVIESPSSSDEC